MRKRSNDDDEDSLGTITRIGSSIDGPTCYRLKLGWHEVYLE
jgi:hypothetical protein